MKAGRNWAMAGAFALLAFSSGAFAQATRTWVSGVGDDANPCSRTAPCKTFQGAIAKTAEGGEINALDPGGYGGVTITKAMTIDGGGGGVAGVLVSSTHGIIVNAGPNDVVTLRNLDIDGLQGSTASAGLDGIRFLAGARLHVENVTVYGFANNAINAAMTTSADVLVKDTIVRTCGTNPGAGISIATAAGQTIRAALDNVTIAGCATGVAALTGAQVSLRNSSVTHATTGVRVASGATLTSDGSRITFNTTGVLADGATLRLTDSTILDNTTGLATVNGGQIVSFNNNRLRGNGTDGAPTTTYYQR